MTMKPALTAEEWEMSGVARSDLNAWAERDGLTLGELSTRNASGTPERGFMVEATDRHALAALALYGQPFGFTREDVEALRNQEREHDIPEVDGFWGSLADRIEALLPPEG